LLLNYQIDFPKLDSKRTGTKTLVLPKSNFIPHEAEFCLAQICIVLDNGNIILISALALKNGTTKGLDFLEGYSHIQASSHQNCHNDKNKRT
jgi:hypothetical protein